MLITCEKYNIIWCLPIKGICAFFTNFNGKEALAFRLYIIS